jgi:ATP-dependent DNA helicase RecG
LAPSGKQVEILRKCREDSAITKLMELIGRSDPTNFRNQVLKPLLEDGLLDLTVPDKPHSSKQKYRLTEKGKPSSML